jgi:hypothetical protein
MNSTQNNNPYLTKTTATATYMRTWSADFDISSVPDDVLFSEAGRRNALKRKSYTGGVVWARHNPAVAGCRCAKCIRRRARAAAEAAAWAASQAK